MQPTLWTSLYYQNGTEGYRLVLIFNREATTLSPEASAVFARLIIHIWFNRSRSATRRRFSRTKNLTCTTIVETFFYGRQRLFIHCLSKQHAPSSPQTPSHQTNFLLILLVSHSLLFAALGRCLLAILSVSLATQCPLLFLSQQESERAFDWLLSTKAAPCAHSAVKDNSNRGRTKEKGSGRGEERETYREKDARCGGKGLWNYTYCKIIIVHNSFFNCADFCPPPLSTGVERGRKEISIYVCFAYHSSIGSLQRATQHIFPWALSTYRVIYSIFIKLSVRSTSPTVLYNAFISWYSLFHILGEFSVHFPAFNILSFFLSVWCDSFMY